MNDSVKHPERSSISSNNLSQQPQPTTGLTSDKILNNITQQTPKWIKMSPEVQQKSVEQSENAAKKLPQQAVKLPGPPQTSSYNQLSYCEKYKADMKLSYKTYINYHGAKNTSTPKQLCLLTQLTTSRFGRLRQVAEHWQGTCTNSS